MSYPLTKNIEIHPDTLAINIEGCGTFGVQIQRASVEIPWDKGGPCPVTIMGLLCSLDGSSVTQGRAFGVDEQAKGGELWVRHTPA